MQTTPRIFQSAVQKFGSRTALRYKAYGLWHDISWNEYYRQSASVASALITMGLEKGDRAAIIGDNCPEWVITDMGIQCAGGMSVGIYATNPYHQVKYVIEHSEAKFLFVENEEQLDKWLQFRNDVFCLKRVIVWDTKGLLQFKDPMVMTFKALMMVGDQADKAYSKQFQKRIRSIEPHDVAVLIYTSGTTGPPKGAMLTHRNVTWMASAIATDNPIHETDEVLSFLPLCHIFERLFSVFAHIKNGYTLNFIESLDTVADNMKEVSPTIGYAVPRIWEKYHSAIMIRMSDATWFKRFMFKWALKNGHKRTTLKINLKPIPFLTEVFYRLAHFIVLRKLKDRMGFERIRVAYSGAAPISPDILHFFQSIGVNLIEGYGQTEGTGVTSLSRIGCVKFGTVGQPLVDTKIKIAQDGEILVKSPGVFKGYFKNDAATEETLKEGWMYSGDIGQMDAEGYLKITDRKKDIIITAGGKNITPQYIENKIKFSRYVNDAVVIGDRRKYLTALIMIDEDNVVKYAQDNKIQFSTYKDLTRNRDIIDRIQKEINTVNGTLAAVEQIKKFTILPKKLYEEDGEVTPTMKVKRKFVNEAFADTIDAMYGH
jgi:long-chain acyl-CoA synthetase